MHGLCLPVVEFPAIPRKGDNHRDSRDTAMTRELLPVLRDLPACPAAGTGVHSWIMSTAHYCRRCGMVEAEAVQFIAARITRPPSPPNEIETAVSKAYHTTAFSGIPRQYSQQKRRAVPLAEIKYDEAKLRAVAARSKAPASWRHWLWERSQMRPETQNAISFLARLYGPGETVHVFDKMDGIEGKHPRWTFKISNPMDCRVPSEMRDGGRFRSGVWFLCNPVDGHWHPNPRQNGEPSCRSEESLTSFRYAVLESDVAPACLWLAFVVQIPARIAAIYTSGSRSIHTLVQIDARSKAEWDSTAGQWKRPLKVLGGDAACLSAVRLSRLPGCARPEKSGFQKLLYLAPNPPCARLIDLPLVHTRFEMLQRWRGLCPRWNRSMEAHG
jgi:hypothetical protein